MYRPTEKQRKKQEKELSEWKVKLNAITIKGGELNAISLAQSSGSMDGSKSSASLFAKGAEAQAVDAKNGAGYADALSRAAGSTEGIMEANSTFGAGQQAFEENLVTADGNSFQISKNAMEKQKQKEFNSYSKKINDLEKKISPFDGLDGISAEELSPEDKKKKEEIQGQIDEMKEARDKAFASKDAALKKSESSMNNLRTAASVNSAKSIASMVAEGAEINSSKDGVANVIHAAKLKAIQDTQSEMATGEFGNDDAFRKVASQNAEIAAKAINNTAKRRNQLNGADGTEAWNADKIAEGQAIDSVQREIQQQGVYNALKKEKIGDDGRSFRQAAMGSEEKGRKSENELLGTGKEWTKRTATGDDIKTMSKVQKNAAVSEFGGIDAANAEIMKHSGVHGAIRDMVTAAENKGIQSSVDAEKIRGKYGSHLEGSFRGLSLRETLGEISDKKLDEQAGSALGIKANKAVGVDYADNAMYGEMSKQQSTKAKIDAQGGVDNAVRTDTTESSMKAIQQQQSLAGATQQYLMSAAGGSHSKEEAEKMSKAILDGGKGAAEFLKQAMSGAGSLAFAQSAGKTASDITGVEVANERYSKNGGFVGLQKDLSNIKTRESIGNTKGLLDVPEKNRKDFISKSLDKAALDGRYEQVKKDFQRAGLVNNKGEITPENWVEGVAHLRANNMNSHNALVAGGMVFSGALGDDSTVQATALDSLKSGSDTVFSQQTKSLASMYNALKDNENKVKLNDDGSIDFKNSSQESLKGFANFAKNSNLAKNTKDNFLNDFVAKVADETGVSESTVWGTMALGGAYAANKTFGDPAGKLWNSTKTKDSMPNKATDIRSDKQPNKSNSDHTQHRKLLSKDISNFTQDFAKAQGDMKKETKTLSALEKQRDTLASQGKDTSTIDSKIEDSKERISQHKEAMDIADRNIKATKYSAEVAKVEKIPTLEKMAKHGKWGAAAAALGYMGYEAYEAVTGGGAGETISNAVDFMTTSHGPAGGSGQVPGSSQHKKGNLPSVSSDTIMGGVEAGLTFASGFAGALLSPTDAGAADFDSFASMKRTAAQQNIPQHIQTAFSTPPGTNTIQAMQQTPPVVSVSPDVAQAVSQMTGSSSAQPKLTEVETNTTSAELSPIKQKVIQEVEQQAGGVSTLSNVAQGGSGSSESPVQGGYVHCRVIN